MSTELVQYDDRRDLRNPATDSWTDVLEAVADLARKVADTDFVPDGFRGNIGATAAAILYGREVGMGPMQALGSLHSIKGRVAMSAEAMRAKALEAGHEIIPVEMTGAKCVVKGRRRGSDDWTTVTWTLDDARRARLSGDNWTHYPRQMLEARATAELCRLIFADVLHGIPAVEELESEGAAVAALPSADTTRVGRRKAPPPPPLPAALEAAQDAATRPASTGEGQDPDPPDSATGDQPDTPTPPADPTPPPDPPAPAVDPRGSKITAGQSAKLLWLSRSIGTDFGELASPIVGRTVTKRTQLNTDEADLVIAALQATLDRRSGDNQQEIPTDDGEDTPLREGEDD